MLLLLTIRAKLGYGMVDKLQEVKEIIDWLTCNGREIRINNSRVVYRTLLVDNRVIYQTLSTSDVHSSDTSRNLHNIHLCQTQRRFLGIL